MTQELIYTSATSGLKPGSKGFCTVAATNGIAPRTVTLLETLSGYRHTFPPSELPSLANPIAWMHLHTPGGDSLLSRVADAGLDYSGRSNKIAHHVLLASNEHTVAGPTAMMRAEGNLIATWNGPARWLAARSLQSGTLHPGSPATIPATTWKTLTGDAGWAGILAQAVLSPAKPDCYVIYGTGQENQILMLFDEAIALLPPSLRWQVTLHTFFCKLPPGMACQWRGILKGSPEHRLVPPHNRVVTVDLTADLATAPNGPLVHYARTGQTTSAGSLTASRVNERIESSQSGHSLSARPEPVGTVVAPTSAQRADETAVPPREPLENHPPELDVRRDVVTTSRTRRKSGMPWIVATVCWLLFFVVGGSYAVWQTTQTPAVDKPARPAQQFTDPKAQPNVEQLIAVPELPTEPEQESDHMPPMLEPPAIFKVDDKLTTMGDAKTEIQTLDPSSEDSSDPATAPKPSPPLPEIQADSLPEPIRVGYLLDPTLWRQLERSGDQWNQDQSIDHRPWDLPPPVAVEVLKLSSTGEMTGDEKFNYNAKNYTVTWGELDRGRLQPPSKVVRFEPQQIILQVNYAQRIRDRFLFVHSIDDAILLTLQGAVTPDRGMDGRLPLALELKDETATAAVSLGAINPRLLSIAKVTMRSSQPDRWRAVKIDDGIELERSFGNRQPVNAPPTHVKVNVRLQRNEEPRLLINATVEQPAARPRRQSSGLSADERDLGSPQNARNELPANSIDVDVTAEFRWQTRRYKTTLSQFRIGFE